MGNRKTVFVGAPSLQPEAQAILAKEVDLLYGLPEGERDRSTDPVVQAERQARIREALAASIGSIHGIYGYVPVDADLIRQGTNLEVIVCPGSGFENVDVEAATAQGIPVVNAAGAAYVPVAEHVIGLMLSLVKWIGVADRHAHVEKVQRSNTQTMAAMGAMPSVLWHKTIGIVGYGFIGRALAQKCLHGFEMTVIAHDPYYDPVEAERHGVTLVADLDDLLATADFVSINSPLTPETQGLIGGRELGLMKSTAILLNASRGGTVDTDALVAALVDGRIAGAGLDVAEPEPLPPGHPLFDLENVVITPHIGGIAREFMPKMARVTADAGLAVLRGQRPHNLVNGPAVWSRVLERRAASAT